MSAMSCAAGELVSLHQDRAVSVAGVPTAAERRARALARVASRDDFRRHCQTTTVMEGTMHAAYDVLASVDADTLYVILSGGDGQGRIMVTCAAVETAGVLSIAQQLVLPGCASLTMLELATGRRRIVVHGAAMAGVRADEVAGWFDGFVGASVEVVGSDLDVARLEARLGLSRDGQVGSLPSASLVSAACRAGLDEGAARRLGQAALEAARLDLLAVIVCVDALFIAC